MGGWCGRARGSQDPPTPSHTYGRARPAGRRAGRARAVPGGTPRRCTRCTPASRGDTSHRAPCPAEQGDPRSTGTRAPPPHLSLQHRHGGGLHKGKGGDDEALVVAGEGQLRRGGSHRHQLRPVVVPSEGTPWRAGPAVSACEPPPAAPSPPAHPSTRMGHWGSAAGPVLGDAQHWCSTSTRLGSVFCSSRTST